MQLLHHLNENIKKLKVPITLTSEKNKKHQSSSPTDLMKKVLGKKVVRKISSFLEKYLA